MPKKITILGSTGSIGENTLDLVSYAGPDIFDVVCLTANSNAQKLADQALKFRPEFVVLADPKNADVLKNALNGSGIKIGIGTDDLKEAGAWPADFIMAAIIGAAGLEPTLAAVSQGKYVGLANKECLVCAGALFIDAVKRSGTVLLPVDSEHNAIFQVLNQERYSEVNKLILTASGGPFRTLSMDEMQNITRAQALSHPVWEMGAKITIDSATLMNKGLELIEASYLFNRPPEDIDIVIHPQSIIHSMVSYIDGTVLAQMGEPDMRTPIAYAMAWPERMATPVKSLDLASVGKLEFHEPNLELFPALTLARDTLTLGGAAPTVLNAANEIAVAGFLAEKLSFLGISRCVDKVLNSFISEQSFTKPLEMLSEVNDYDARARARALETIKLID
ncbi:MAG: 1-deoxy-D-xylulose-5-phosphate reductoisomerase [Robiginitomaculum sp.]|nr:1-deoxy-D-xylulose-5-phosphate reductoisomerase [Robiginitomaculum sp.]